MAPHRSFLEAGVRQTIVHQVTDAVHRVLEEGGGGEDDHPDRWIDEGDDVEGGNESGEFPDLGEVFERFGHGVACHFAGTAEGFNRSMRREVLDTHLFANLREVRGTQYQWMLSYNEECPPPPSGTSHQESSNSN